MGEPRSDLLLGGIGGKVWRHGAALEDALDLEIPPAGLGIAVWPPR